MKITELNGITEGIFSRFFGGEPAPEPAAKTKPPDPVYLEDDELNSVINDIVFWIHRNIDVPEKRKLLKAATESRVKPWELTIFGDWLKRWSQDFESRERYRKFSKEAILKAYGRRIRKSVYDNWFSTK